MPTEVTITRAHAVEQIAQRIVGEHHGHLIEARILYLFTDKPKQSKGQSVLATASKLDAVKRWMTSDMDGGDDGYDFLLMFDSKAWAVLEADQRRALVDHELCHCQKGINDDGSPKWWIRGHDVEEFAAVIERHGLWHRSVKAFAVSVVAATQMALPLDPPRDVATVVLDFDRAVEKIAAAAR